MKTLVCPYVHMQDWIEDYFPGCSLCSLPVAGKPYSGYLLDLAFMLRSREALVLDYDFDMEFSNILSARESKSFAIRYIGSELLPSVEQLLKKHRKFITSDDCLIFFGAVMPDISAPEELMAELEPVAPEEETASGVFLHRDGQLYRCAGKICPMDSLKDFYELNFRLLNTPGAYALPGYSTEKNVFLGENVEIMSNAVSAPLILGDHSSIARHCVLKNGVIVGSNTVIDHSAKLEHTIVFDNVFIGRGTELSGKIVFKNRVIDPEDGSSIPLEQGVNSAVEITDISVATRVVSCITACLLGVLSLPLLIILFPLYLKDPRDPRLSALSYDRYCHFWLAAIGIEDLIYVQEHGKPFVFRASDAHIQPPDEKKQRLDDMFYLYHNSPGLVVKIVTKALINRLSEKRLK